MNMMTSAVNERLAEISRKIKSFEKRTLKDVIETGRLLHEAELLCEHGTYMAWLDREFGWSHETSLNYRKVYALSQNPNCSDFETWDMSLRAFYVLCGYLASEHLAQQIAGKAILEAAKAGRRINYKEVQRIYFDSHNTHPPMQMGTRADLAAAGAALAKSRNAEQPAAIKAPDVAKAPRELTQALNVVWLYLERSDKAWSKVDGIRLGGIVTMLQATYRTHFGGEDLLMLANMQTPRHKNGRAPISD